MTEGFLTKQGQRFKTWKRRWCVVIATARRSPGDDDGGHPQPVLASPRLFYAKQPQACPVSPDRAIITITITIITSIVIPTVITADTRICRAATRAVK